jgi:predicted O-methyltransferase YrrM
MPLPQTPKVNMKPDTPPLPVAEPVFAVAEGARVKQAFPLGHYYSPIPDLAQLARKAPGLWGQKPFPPGLDFCVGAQLALLKALAAYVPSIHYPVEAATRPDEYFYNNGMYPVLDAEFLFAFLCHTRPARVIEVGSGFSSLVMADANRRMLDHAVSILCIEPYPRDFLRTGVSGISRLVTQPVETVGQPLFEALDAGDILFIDSSHVCKTGSDVNFLYLDMLPRLKAGVVVHIHDIFLPDEYPQSWVMDEGRAWNEQYLLHAFLLGNRDWEVVWTAHYMATRFPEAVSATFPRYPSLGSGGSLWMRKLG